MKWIDTIKHISFIDHGTIAYIGQRTPHTQKVTAVLTVAFF